MRLSDERIGSLARQVATALARSPRVQLTVDVNDIRLRVQQVIHRELALEDEIDARVRRMIRSYARPLPEGSRTWDVEYERLFEQELERRRG